MTTRQTKARASQSAVPSHVANELGSIPNRLQLGGVLVIGGFDDIHARDLRFLEEAAKAGPLTVGLLPDAALAQTTGARPKFPFAERKYFLEAVRFVERVLPWRDDAPYEEFSFENCFLLAERGAATAPALALARARGLAHRTIGQEALGGFAAPAPALPPTPNGRKKVVVTGCYDWFHSGHVRFFEEASRFGDLYVCIGNDACIRGLKGKGHPLLTQQERHYVVASIRHVAGAVISSGTGWLDADAEIRALKPDYYVVNADGDKGGKADYCRSLGIAYTVLERTPAPGLPKRSSTDLRGF